MSPDAGTSICKGAAAGGTNAGTCASGTCAGAGADAGAGAGMCTYVSPNMYVMYTGAAIAVGSHAGGRTGLSSPAIMSLHLHLN